MVILENGGGDYHTGKRGNFLMERTFSTLLYLLKSNFKSDE